MADANVPLLALKLIRAVRTITKLLLTPKAIRKNAVKYFAPTVGARKCVKKAKFGWDGFLYVQFGDPTVS
jgi:hypothetical protein